MATDKASLQENEGNVQNAFPSQLIGHYDRVLVRLCCGVGDGLSLAWYGGLGLFAQQISWCDDC
jgi:hypothetical protein